MQPAGIDIEQAVESKRLNGHMNGEHINGANGERINGDATVEEQLAELEDGECDACTI